jgi:hypothetical protein
MDGRPTANAVMLTSQFPYAVTHNNELKVALRISFLLRTVKFVTAHIPNKVAGEISMLTILLLITS